MRLELKNTDEITRQNEAMPESEIAPIAEQALDGAAIDRELKRQVQPLDVVSTRKWHGGTVAGFGRRCVQR